MQKYLVQHVRDLNRRYIGTVVATSPDNIGWAQVHEGKEANFSKQNGTYIALTRAVCGNKSTHPAATKYVRPILDDNGYIRKTKTVKIDHFKPVLEKMAERAARYFGEKTVKKYVIQANSCNEDWPDTVYYWADNRTNGDMWVKNQKSAMLFDTAEDAENYRSIHSISPAKGWAIVKV